MKLRTFYPRSITMSIQYPRKNCVDKQDYEKSSLEVDWEVVVIVSSNDTAGGVLTGDSDDVGEHIYRVSTYNPMDDMVHLYQLGMYKRIMAWIRSYTRSQRFRSHR